MDPLSVFASLLTITTAGAQSARSLKGAISRYKARDATLRRLLDRVADVENILVALEQLLRPAAHGNNAAALLETNAASSMPLLLRGPVERCSEICCTFEESMEQFVNKSKTSFMDWAKMEFRRGDINQFMDLLGEYKATIAVGVGVLTMRMAKVTREALDDYDQLVQETTYDLQLRLQRIDDKLQTLAPSSGPSASGADIDLNDERQVTEQCLRICQDAKSYLESLANRDASLLQEPTMGGPEKSLRDSFKAQLLTRQAFDDNQTHFVGIISQLRERLASVMADGDATERTRLEADIQTSRQCLEVCKLASNEVSNKKIHIIGDVTADGDSDHMVVTTLADMFNVGDARATNGSALLVGSMSDETLQQISRDRYSSRFGSAQTHDLVSKRGGAAAKDQSTGQAAQSFPHPEASHQHSALGTQPPAPNETRKRAEGRE